MRVPTWLYRATSASSPLLWWAGLGVTLGVLVIVAWGRVRAVDVPRIAVPEYPVLLCVGPEVPRLPLEEAVGLWVGAGHDVRIVQPCEDGAITVHVDPALVDLLAPPDPVMDGGEAHGVTELVHLAGRVDRASVLLYDGRDPVVVAHEIGHALGYLHARWAPTGHLMAPEHERLGRDVRGLEVMP